MHKYRTQCRYRTAGSCPAAASMALSPAKAFSKNFNSHVLLPQLHVQRNVSLRSHLAVITFGRALNFISLWPLDPCSEPSVLCSTTHLSPPQQSTGSTNANAEQLPTAATVAPHR